MENFGYKFVLMTDILQTVKAILFQPLQCILYLSHNSDIFILYYPFHEVNLCLPPDFGGSGDQPQSGFFQVRERTLGTVLPLTSSGCCREESGGCAWPAKSKMTPKWRRPLTNHSVREITANTFLVSII